MRGLYDCLYGNRKPKGASPSGKGMVACKESLAIAKAHSGAVGSKVLYLFKVGKAYSHFSSSSKEGAVEVSSTGASKAASASSVKSSDLTWSIVPCSASKNLAKSSL